MDRYHIYEAIGRGKHSVVYKGRRKKTIQHYAIKSVDKSQRPRVLQEVQVLRSLSHDLVLKFYAWYETQNHLWLILEYCVGGDLLALLRQDEALPPKSVAAFGRDLAVALYTLHKSGTLHCDLKPSNVLVDENGRLKLCGFGLAKKTADAAKDGPGGVSGGGEGGPKDGLSKRGTPCYMAPELFTEGGVHSYASDLYALGCVLYECCVGKPPFVSNSLTELMEMILNDDPPPLFNGERAREIGESPAGGGSAVGPDPPTPALADLITGLLEKDPARRLDWNAVLRHPFWRESGTGSCAEDLLTLASHPLPPQPAFQTYLAASGTSGRAEVVAHVSDRLAALTTSSSASPAGSSTGPNQQRGRGKEGGGGGGDENASPGTSGGGGRRRTSSSGFTHQTHLSPSSREALRMSVNARANLEREGAGAYASRTPEKRRTSTEEGGAAGGGDPSPGPGASDVELADTDAELNFADATRDDGGVNDGGVNDREHNRSRPASADPAGDEHATLSRVGSARVGGGMGDRGVLDEEEDGEEEDGDGDLLGGRGRPTSAGGYAALAATTTDESTARTPPPAESVGRGASGIDRVNSLPSPAATPPGVGLASSRATFANRLGVESRSLSGPRHPPPRDAQSNDATNDAADAAARDMCAELSDHPSDSQVKPIVLNRRIEAVPESHYDPNALPFEPLAISDMLAAPQQDLERFLTQIYRSVAHSSPINEKVNTLAYFETLCTDTAAANVLINSSLMTLFVRMLRASKAPTLRIRLSSVMGLLLRHATYISEELASSGVVTVLTECLKDKNERVRRRAMATLGELLFYIATQQHEAGLKAPADGAGGPPGAWQIPPATVGTVTRMLRQGEDEIAQHYAVKTIENIASHGGDWAHKFSSQETVGSLVAIMSGAKSEQLRGTAASTLSRAARHSPAVLNLVLDKYGIKILVNGLRDTSPKVQQASLNLLNRGLADLGARARASLASEDNRMLLPTLVSLLERGSAVLRGKALLTLASLFRLHNRWLLAACGTRLFSLVDRLQKDRERYLQRCLEALVATVVAAVPRLHDAILREIDRLVAGGRPGSRESGTRSHGGVTLGGGGLAGIAGASVDPSRPGTPGTAGSPLALFPALVHLLGSLALRPRLCDDAFLLACATYVSKAEGPNRCTFPGAEQFRTDVFALLETLSQCAPTLVQTAPGAVTSALLPALADVLARGGGSGAGTGSGGSSADGRFLALKLTCDLALPLWLDPDLDDNTGSERDGSNPGDDGSNRNGRREALAALIRGVLLPLCPALLGDEDPIPLYALKLLGGALEADAGMCGDAARLGLAPKFFEFLSLEHTNNNVHNVRLCLALARSRAVRTLELLCDFAAGHKVAAVLAYAHENAVEPFLEPSLGICAALFTRVVDLRDENGSRNGSDQTDDALDAAMDGVAPLLDVTHVLIECASAGETEVASFAVPSLAAQSLRLAVDLFPEEASAAIFARGTPLADAVDALGTAAAVDRGERGFADVDLPHTGGPSPGGAGAGAGATSSSGSSSPRRGFARAQRSGLGAIAAAATAAARRSSPPFDSTSLTPGETTRLEAALRRLARGEPCGVIARAAAEAADGVAEMLARAPR